MSGTESHTDREEDYKFLHSMLMEKKVHLLFKVKISHPLPEVIALLLTISVNLQKGKH